jgi:hypothetical protein
MVRPYAPRWLRSERHFPVVEERWCELHHRRPWAQGGRTDLADAIPLCAQHHHWIHDTGFNHQTMPDGTIRFSRRI